MWKLQNFSVTLILREINFGDSKSAKYAILSQLEALNFDFYDFVHFLKVENYQINKMRAFEIAKMAVFLLPQSLKLISRKIQGL